MLERAEYSDGDPVFRTPGYWRGRKTAGRVSNASIPKHLDGFRFADMAVFQQGVVRLWENWDDLTRHGPIVTITGARRVGKSAAAAALLHRIVSTDVPARSGYYTTADALRRMYTESAQNDGRLADDWPDPFLLTHCRSGFDVLVIDDLGREPTNEGRTAALATLLGARQADLLVTIVVLDSSVQGANDVARVYQNDYLSSLLFPEPSPFDDPKHPAAIEIEIRNR